MAILLGEQFWLSITIFFKVDYYTKKFLAKKGFQLFSRLQFSLD